jgi:hypothetical protein
VTTLRGGTSLLHSNAHHDIAATPIAIRQRSTHIYCVSVILSRYEEIGLLNTRILNKLVDVSKDVRMRQYLESRARNRNISYGNLSNLRKILAHACTWFHLFPINSGKGGSLRHCSRKRRGFKPHHTQIFMLSMYPAIGLKSLSVVCCNCVLCLVSSSTCSEIYVHIEIY